MKTRLVLVFCLFVAGALTAHELVTNVVVRQRRPWSNVVDIDYLYTGLCPTSMAVTATWDGQAEPVSLVSLHTEGVTGVTLGPHTLTWDPVAAGYGEETLKNFKVEIAPSAHDLRTYLVIDLKDGGYTLMARAPEVGWTDEYKTTKLVLKRLSKGTYRWGTSEHDEYRAAWSGGQSGAIGRGATLHDVTYTSDYYFPIFELTTDQYSWINAGKASGDTRATCPYWTFGLVYTSLRGATLDDGVTPVCWPQTGHQVNSTSFIGKLRAIITRKNQPELLADLPTVDQWQLPMSGGRNTFWPNGGTAAEKDLPGIWQSYMDAICWTSESNAGYNNPVGEKDPNDWGFYDFLVNFNPCLNWINASSTVDNHNPSYIDRGDRTDDVGPEEPTPFTNGNYIGQTFRVACGQTARDALKPGYANTIFNRKLIPETEEVAFMVPRIVVNMKPLVK